MDGRVAALRDTHTKALRDVPAGLFLVLGTDRRAAAEVAG
jgi:hypothetical protein